MSEAEIILWSRLRGRGPDRPTFRRQHPMGGVILDFYCPRARLAIEVDGATHWDDRAQAKDAARDLWLQRQGVSVMRIPASQVYRDLGGVVDAIVLRVEALEGPRRPLAPSTPRSSAGKPASAGGPSRRRRALSRAAIRIATVWRPVRLDPAASRGR